MLLAIYVYYDDYINFFTYAPERIGDDDLQYFVSVLPLDRDISIPFPLFKCDLQL